MYMAGNLVRNNAKTKRLAFCTSIVAMRGSITSTMLGPPSNWASGTSCKKTFLCILLFIFFYNVIIFLFSMLGH